MRHLLPEESAAAYVEARLDTVEVFKIHVQVGNFSVTDPLLDGDLGTGRRGRHAGGAARRERTGRLRRTPDPDLSPTLLARHPRLRLVIAHMGAPEYVEFLELAETYERVHVDTTMAFTDFFSEMGGVFPADLLPRVRELGLAGKVLLGSDFPNIPYPYLHQLESLERLDLGDDWLRAVCWGNGHALVG